MRPEAGIRARLETTFLCAYRPQSRRLGATATDNRFCARTHTESLCRTVCRLSVVEKELGGKSVFYVVSFRDGNVCDLNVKFIRTPPHKGPGCKMDLFVANGTYRSSRDIRLLVAGHRP